ncbi:MAG: DUF4035 domain-containing protein [Candidatus Obscuribacterales bacterium]|nr:DUF4035 domain-containing protein [Candidatus Obscuribacterales bacterium]
MSVAQAQREINLVEFVHWQAFYKIEPFGEQRDDFRNGYLMSLLANINKSKDARAFKAIDFMPFIDGGTREEQSLEEQARILERYVRNTSNG